MTFDKQPRTMPHTIKQSAQDEIVNTVHDLANLHIETASNATPNPENTEEDPEADTNALFDSDAEGSDIFDEDDYEYDSDGNIILSFDAETDTTSADRDAIDPTSFKITPAHIDRFIDSLPVIQFTDLDLGDQKCGVCHSRYQVLGQTNELALQLCCGHVVGRKCLGVWLGEMGRRSCPVCERGLPVWGA